MNRAAAIQRAQGFDAIDRASELSQKARRHRRRGEVRRAVLALREACALDETDAARWMVLGALAGRIGRRDEAERAMKQALYLRERRGERARANVIRGLLLNLASAVSR